MREKHGAEAGFMTLTVIKSDKTAQENELVNAAYNEIGILLLQHESEHLHVLLTKLGELMDKYGQMQVAAAIHQHAQQQKDMFNLIKPHGS